MKKVFLIFIIILAFFLRFYKLDQIPPGLYQDEPPLGYASYSILHTGKGPYGDRLFFKSFSDPRMPVYIYSTVPAIALFGNTDFAVRFISALSGSLTVMILFLFVQQLVLLDKTLAQKFKDYLPILSALILSVLPWHLQFSRAGFEATEALFFFLLSNLFFLKYIRNKKTVYLILFNISLVLSIYCYNAYRIISIVDFSGLTIYAYRYFPKLRKELVINTIFLVILLIPMILFSLSASGEKRFSDTSALSELGKLKPYQALYKYPALLLKNYLSYFSFYFLFDNGDGIGRHQIPNFGLLFKWQLPFLLAGIFWFVNQVRLNIGKLIIFLLIISPLAGFITTPSPHTLRSLTMVVPISIAISVGLIIISDKLQRFAKPFLVLVALVAVFELLYYLRYYYVHYPITNLNDWGAGMKDTVLKTNELSKDYQFIVVDKTISFASDYFHYYKPNLSFTVAGQDLAEKMSKDKKVLYITRDYGRQINFKLVYIVKLKNKMGDSYTKFYSL